MFSNLSPIVNALGVSRITSCVSLKILVSHIVSNSFIIPLNSTTSSYLFFVKNKVAGMICCLNMMALSFKMRGLYFPLLLASPQIVSKVIVITATPCHVWHPGPDATLLII
jgi:hypothetical protein